MNETKWSNHLALAVKANSSDNPRWHKAINGPDKTGYWEAMKVEITTLTKLKAWKVIPKTSEKNILDSTWAIKCKRWKYSKI